MKTISKWVVRIVLMFVAGFIIAWGIMSTPLSPVVTIPLSVAADALIGIIAGRITAEIDQKNTDKEW